MQAATPISTYWNTTNDVHGATAKGYMPEMSWNGTCTNPLLLSVYTSYTNNEALCNAAKLALPGLVQMGSGGGGVSNCTVNNTTPTSTTWFPASCSGGYAKPAWQAGVTGIPADGKRDLPDVSLFGSYGFASSTGIPGSALLICQASGSPLKSCDYTHPGYITYQENGGTSAASPMAAGVMALVLQKVGANQGLANPMFYSLAAKEDYAACDSNTAAASNACIFYDTTTGTNAMNCTKGDKDCVTSVATNSLGILSGNPATAGYDLTTGLGSFNVTNLVNAWAAAITAPAVTLTPTSLTFAPTTVGVTTAAQVVTMTNSGNAALTLTSETLTGTNATSFLISANTCTASLGAGVSCTVSVEFKPAATGALTAALSIADNATGSPQTVALSGTGAATTPAVTLTPASLTFASTTVGSTTSAQVVTIQNSGNAALTLTSETLTGTNATSFLISANTCTASLAAGVSCTVSVEFRPTAAGALTAALSIADNATGSPQTVALSGTGSAAPTQLATTTTLSSSNSSAGTGMTITLTASVTKASGVPTGSVTFLNGTTSLGTGTLDASGSASLTTSFATAGAYSLTATYGGDATSLSSTSAVVTETVVAVGLSAAVNPSSLTIVAGQSGTLTITLTPTGGYTGSVSFSCGTLPARVTCIFAPASVTIAAGSGPVTDTLTINTGATTVAMLSGPRFGAAAGGIFFASVLWVPGLLTMAGIFRRNGKRFSTRRLIVLGIFCLAMMGAGGMTGCGGGTSNAANNAATPGTYAVPIAITLAGGPAQNVSVTIVVK